MSVDYSSSESVSDYTYDKCTNQPGGIEKKENDNIKQIEIHEQKNKTQKINKKFQKLKRTLNCSKYCDITIKKNIQTSFSFDIIRTILIWEKLGSNSQRALIENYVSDLLKFQGISNDEEHTLLLAKKIVSNKTVNNLLCCLKNDNYIQKKIIQNDD